MTSTQILQVWQLKAYYEARINSLTEQNRVAEFRRQLAEDTIKRQKLGNTYREAKLIKENKKLKQSLRKLYEKYIKPNQAATEDPKEEVLTYRVTLSNRHHVQQCSDNEGCSEFYQFYFEGEKIKIATQQFQFTTTSLEKAKAALKGTSYTEISLVIPKNRYV